ncbi:uncharacterized protein LOC126549687 [Aphis gossypii]|uniref:uncharacterized protein LOC126549687 n=1 Tax=Aphis gossypii TaxID=80765 RepID=UPI0021592DA2|nr:uncharacterized protein LOC126549687 [Aphis gossypii]
MVLKTLRRPLRRADKNRLFFFSNGTVLSLSIIDVCLSLFFSPDDNACTSVRLTSAGGAATATLSMLGPNVSITQVEVSTGALVSASTKLMTSVVISSVECASDNVSSSAGHTADFATSILSWSIIDVCLSLFFSPDDNACTSVSLTTVGGAATATFSMLGPNVSITQVEVSTGALVSASTKLMTSIVISSVECASDNVSTSVGRTADFATSILSDSRPGISTSQVRVSTGALESDSTKLMASVISSVECAGFNVGSSPG